MEARPHILMLAGSPASGELAELSRVYARGALDALQEAARFSLLHIAPGGLWSAPATLDAADLAAAKPFDLAGAARFVRDSGAQIGLPQAFCFAGMTSCRALFDLAGLPMLGNPPAAMALAADKWKTRALVAAGGVRVPGAVRIGAGGAVPDPFPLALPVVVKPVASDNSEGVSLVRSPAELAPALDAALAHDGAALAEAFIAPGRELRCAVLQAPDGTLAALPPEEYPVGPDRPIRTKADKLGRSASGTMTLAAKAEGGAWIVGPGDPVTEPLQAAAKRAFRALGCAQYGLFDFRTDADGTPFFLEAGLYNSFSPDSVIAVMARTADISLEDLLQRTIETAFAHPAPARLPSPAHAPAAARHAFSPMEPKRLQA